MGTGQPSSWVCQVLTALDKDDADDYPSELLIWKVPVHFRTNAEHYEPLNWRFGLHHCPENLHSYGTERFKIQVARALELTGERWDTFCKDVVREPKSYWEAVYGQSPHALSYTIEEIRCLLSLDALFLVVYLQHQGGGIVFETECESPTLLKVLENSEFKTYLNAMWRDILLVENQIPMELLKRVVGILRTACRDNVDMPAWEDADWQGRNIGFCIPWYHSKTPIDDSQMRDRIERRMENQLQLGNSYHGVHILDSIYRIVCGWDSLETLNYNFQQTNETMPSATYLESGGVKIKCKEFTCLEDISFENGCLSIPLLSICNDTEKYLRNLVVHEVLTRPRRGSTRCYTFFMDDLMKTPEDVLLLVRRGVVEANVGSYENVVDMWKRINCNIPVSDDVSETFYTMSVNVKSYARLRRNKFLFEFKKQFCSRPWLVLSILAVTFVTIATLIQTYVAVIGSNGMKPHFPPQH